MLYGEESRKKTASIGGKRPKMVAVALAEASKKMEKDNKKSQLPFPLDSHSNEFLVPGGISENVVFSCLLSA